MNVIQCSVCRRPGAWMIDNEIFCEKQKEKIIEAMSVDRFPIRRLSESERVFQGLHGGGRVSRVIGKKK